MNRGAVRNVVGSARVAAGLAWTAARPQVLATLVLTVLDGLVPLALTLATRVLLDAVSGQDPTARGNTVAVCVGVLVLAGATAGGSAAGQTYLEGVVHRAVRLEVRRRLFAAVNAEPGIGQFEDPARQDRIRLAEQAGDVAPQQAISAGIQLVQAAVTVAGFLVTLLVLQPVVFVLVVVASVPIVYLQLRLGRLRADTVADTSVYYRRLLFYRLLATDVRAAKEIRLFGLDRFLGTRMIDDLRTASGMEQRVDRTTARTSLLITAITALVDAVGLGVVGVAAVRGHLSVGDVAAVLAALVAVQQIFRAATDQAANLYQAMLLFEHYRSLVLESASSAVAAAPEPPGVGPLEVLTFEGVWFRYDAGVPWVLRGLDLELRTGTSVGLVGLNGAGKTTIVKLLCRMYEPERGCIRWNGVDLRDLDPGALRARISAVFQDFMSYDFSAADNIAVGQVERRADRAAIVAAAEIAEVHGTVEALPRGYDTMLSRIFPTDEAGERGASLSGGQWQRLALARAFLRTDADVLILDEPSSGLDAELEHALHRRLQDLRRGRLSLLISHRLSALRDADRIVLLENGVVAETGRHAELLSQGGRYARLFALQARGYVEPDDTTGTVDRVTGPPADAIS